MIKFINDLFNKDIFFLHTHIQEHIHEKINFDIS